MALSSLQHTTTHSAAWEKEYLILFAAAIAVAEWVAKRGALLPEAQNMLAYDLVKLNCFTISGSLERYGFASQFLRTSCPPGN